MVNARDNPVTQHVIAAMDLAFYVKTTSILARVLSSPKHVPSPVLYASPLLDDPSIAAITFDVTGLRGDGLSKNFKLLPADRAVQSGCRCHDALNGSSYFVSDMLTRFHAG
jgi:hypothetical protein